MENGMVDGMKKNRVLVSNSKKSLFFYVNLSKRYLQEYNEVELSGLGMAITTVVTVAEILKNSGFAVEKKIRTLTVDMRDDPGARPMPKAKLKKARKIRRKGRNRRIDLWRIYVKLVVHRPVIIKLVVANNHFM